MDVVAVDVVVAESVEAAEDLVAEAEVSVDLHHR